MLNSSGSPLRVALLSISPHNRAILEFFFAGAGKQLFRVTSLQEAEILIIDFDHPGAENEWLQRADKTKPGIVLSVREMQVNNAIWIPKPLTSQALVRAAVQIRALLPQGASTAPANEPQPVRQTMATHMAGATSAHPFGVGQARKVRPSLILDFDEDEPATLTKPVTAPPVERPTEPQPPLRPKVAEPTAPQEAFLTFDEISTPEKNQEQTERRSKLLCGEREDINPSNPQDNMQRFTPDNYLLKHLLDAMQQSRPSGQPIQIKFDSHEQLLLLPALNLAYSSIDISSDAFAELCNTPMQSGRVHLHMPNTAEMAALESTMQADAEHTHDLEAVIWTVTLLTSHGRLNRDTDTSQRLLLKHWPNLTRLEEIPHVMRIAATWHQRPGTVFDIARWLDIPQRYVFAFYTAANTLGLMTVDQGKVEYQEKEAPKKNRGLFSRLLKRLLGGGAK